MPTTLKIDRLLTFLAMPLAGLALLLAGALAPVPALAKDDPAHMNLNGVGEINAKPDMAIVSSGVVTEAKTARAALDANTEAMTRVVDLLRAEGIEQKDLQTSGFSVQPQYTRPRRNSSGEQPPPRIVGYSVSNQLTVKVRDLEKLGIILDKVVSAGSNRVNGVSFTFSNPRTLMDLARARAMEDALRKANIYVDAAGIKLGRITNISEQGSFHPQPRFRTMARAEMAADAAAPVPMEAGQQTLSVQISVTWELDQ